MLNGKYMNHWAKIIGRFIRKVLNGAMILTILRIRNNTRRNRKARNKITFGQVVLLFTREERNQRLTYLRFFIKYVRKIMTTMFMKSMNSMPNSKEEDCALLKN